MKLYVRTFGCRANQYDSETLRALALGAGHELVASAAEADMAVFNSCAVTAEAEADLRKAVRRAARERPELTSIVMGCASALGVRHDGGAAMRALPTVSHVVAGADWDALAAALGMAPGEPLVRAARQAGTRALLRVQEGCDEHCTFCATTLARGASRSRPLTDVVDEARRLAERHPEIVLTGIHIGSYGVERGESLGALVAALVERVPAVRVRLSSLEATEMDDVLLRLMRDAPDRLAPHLHAPLQSGSDRLLRRMGRHWYTAGSYAAAVERIAAACPVLGLGADVICGFPGETEADHADTLALVERLPFTYLHVFPYSPRPGTSAERLTDPVAPPVAQRRARELRTLAEAKAVAYRARRAGGAADVVVLGDEGRTTGLTEDYLTVELADPAMPRGTRFPAELVAREGRLVARPAG